MTRDTTGDPSSIESSVELGRAARRAAPRSSHGDWTPRAGRADPVALLEAQNESRVAWLVPVRHERMRVSPFAFYRGAAGIMASDLAGTPDSGLTVQVGGDAHLSNFGAYASPGRRLVFDANDFDETLRGPWEWDLKRLAASVVIAARHSDMSTAAAHRAAKQATRAYREAMAGFAEIGYLETWNQLVTVDDLRDTARLSQKELSRRLDRFERKAKSKTSQQAVGKLTETVDGRRQIRHDPPVLYPLRNVPFEYGPDEMEGAALEALEAYKATLNDDRHWLLDRYRVVDVGLKVVGVGSVGTRCIILLLEGRDEDDSFFLQAKEAQASVLAPHLGASPYENHGRRIVEGQRLAQAQSDIFLGWTEGRIEHHHFYVRQLRDWKGSIEVEELTPEQLTFYADFCGRTLARGHARSGDPVAISSYLGKSHTFGRAIAAFAAAYADQNLEDFHRFEAAIDSGRLEVAAEPV